MEATVGIGILSGPLLGGLFFTVGGYACPFIIFASAYVILYPFIAYYLI
jgi:hypothetical protein